VNNLYPALWQSLSPSGLADLVRRAVATGVVLDGWRDEDSRIEVAPAAEEVLADEASRLTAEALASQAIFPSNAMAVPYVEAVFRELLRSTAKNAVARGHERVEAPQAREAVARIHRFAAEPRGLTDLGELFFVLTAHGDLGAIGYAGHMAADDFLTGRRHRPWSSAVLPAQLEVYRRLGLVAASSANDVGTLRLTPVGRDALAQLHRMLDQAGELNWRAAHHPWPPVEDVHLEAARARVMVDSGQQIRTYLEELGIHPGMRVLGVGAPASCAAVDAGLWQLVAPRGAVVVLDPSRAALTRLARICRARGIANVHPVQGVVEALPFPDGHFDAAIAIASPPPAEPDRAVKEMARVTKPGGLVIAVSPVPDIDWRDIPMVSQWMQPLSTVADRLGISFTDPAMNRPDALAGMFQRYLTDVRMAVIPATIDASDPRSFLAVALRSQRMFRNLWVRIPYADRQHLARSLEAEGRALARSTPPDAQRTVFMAGAASGRVPAQDNR
jgi:SAM-dependent methyltransferase